MRSIRKAISVGLIFTVLLAVMLFTGCSRVKSADELIELATKNHGDCIVVSEYETDDKSVVVLRDELQGFTYKMESTSTTFDINSSPRYSSFFVEDGFEDALIKYSVDCTMKDIGYYYEMVGATYEYGHAEKEIVTIYLSDPTLAKDIALRTASRLQVQNYRHRLDKETVYVKDSNGKILGSASLPEGRWSATDSYAAEAYIDYVYTNFDSGATFDYTVDLPFYTTGANIDMVSDLGSKYPKDEVASVTYYYFHDSDGKEFYVCDFYYFWDEEQTEYTRYTNYYNR